MGYEPPRWYRKRVAALARSDAKWARRGAQYGMADELDAYAARLLIPPGVDGVDKQRALWRAKKARYRARKRSGRAA